MKHLKRLALLSLAAVLTVTSVPHTAFATGTPKEMKSQESSRQLSRNLALNKPVEGTPDIYPEPGNPGRYAVEHAVDGNLNTLWGPYDRSAKVAELTIDLEAAEKYNCVKFFGRAHDTADRTEKLVVLASDDKSTWREVSSKACDTANMTIYFDDQVSRYVRIQMIAKSGKEVPATAELELYYEDGEIEQVLNQLKASVYSYVDLGGTVEMNTVCLDELGNEIPKEEVTFNFKSSDPSVVTISEKGVIKGITKGKVTVTVTAEFNGTVKTAARTIYSGFITPEVKRDNENPSKQQADMMENRNYGLMMHFGINTFNNAQWTDGTKPVSSYAPETIDADQWARVASEAGFTHIVLVSMHHDGFCMWDTQYTDYKCTNPESKNTTDVIKAAAEACEKYGVKLGLYYSLWNRHETFYKDDLAYLEHMKNQFTELLGGEYGEICEIWLDGAWDKSADRWYLPELYDHIKTLQPDCQVGVNWTIGGADYKTHPSDYQKYENIRYFPSDFKTWDGETIKDYDEPKIFTYGGENYYLPYEETVCIRNPFGGFSWFWDESYNKGNLYPVEKIQESMQKLHSRGNIFLLNMGIDKTGHMVDSDVATAYKAADALGIAKGSAVGSYAKLTDDEKNELLQLVRHYREMDFTPYSKASVRTLMKLVDQAEAAGKGESDLRHADVEILKKQLAQAKENLELYVASDNLAYEKVVEASPRPYSNDYVPENAVDGDEGTLWGPVDGYSESSIVIDLEREENFTEICLDGRASDTVSRVASYEIQIGNVKNADGTYEMETLLSDIPCTGSKQTIEFEPVTARYIKLIVHATANKVPAFKEISVYDRSEPEVDDGIYTVYVNGAPYKTDEYNTKVELHADETQGKFVCWMAGPDAGNLKPISKKPDYTFYLANDIYFEAVYNEEKQIEPEALLVNTIAMAAAEEGRINARFVGQLAVPEGAKVLDAGLVWSGSPTPDKMELESGAKVTHIKSINSAHQFSVTVNGVPKGKTVRGVVFALIELPNGETIHTVYSVEGAIAND